VFDGILTDSGGTSTVRDVPRRGLRWAALVRAQAFIWEPTSNEFCPAVDLIAISMEQSETALRPATYSGVAGFAGPRNDDLSPDGKRFLMMIKEGGQDRGQQISDLIVVENWFETAPRRFLRPSTPRPFNLFWA
jgi:hypothetical protein